MGYQTGPIPGQEKNVKMRQYKRYQGFEINKVVNFGPVIQNYLKNKELCFPCMSFNLNKVY